MNDRLVLGGKTIYLFDYEELKPLLDFLERETIPTEKHFPGMREILTKLMIIKTENEL